MGRETRKSYHMPPVQLPNLSSASRQLLSNRTNVPPRQPPLHTIDFKKQPSRPLQRSISTDPDWTNYQLQKLVESTPVPKALVKATSSYKNTSEKGDFNQNLETLPILRSYRQSPMPNSTSTATPELAPRKLFHSSEEPTPLLSIKKSPQPFLAPLPQRHYTTDKIKENNRNTNGNTKVHFKEENEYVPDTSINSLPRKRKEVLKKEPSSKQPNKKRRLSEVLLLQKSLETAAWTDSVAVERQTEPIVISDDDDDVPKRRLSDTKVRKTDDCEKKNSKGIQKSSKIEKENKSEKKREKSKSDHKPQSKKRTRRTTAVDIQMSSGCKGNLDVDIPEIDVHSRMQTRSQSAKDPDAESMIRTGNNKNGGSYKTSSHSEIQQDSSSAASDEKREITVSKIRGKSLHQLKKKSPELTKKHKKQHPFQVETSTEEDDEYGLIHVGLSESQWKSFRVCWGLEFKPSSHDFLDMKPAEMAQFLQGPFGLGDTASNFMITPTLKKKKVSKSSGRKLRSTGKKKSKKKSQETTQHHDLKMNSDSEQTQSDAVANQ